MRITNKMLSNNFLRDMRTNLNNMNTLQGQMTSGKQITKASDDPFKATRIMQMHSDIDANKQYDNNIKDSINWLDTTDTALGQVGDSIGRIEELLVSAGNGAYSANERTAIKDEINQKIGEISQILNTSFDGKYIFGGTDGTSKPVYTGKDTAGNTQLICNTKVVGKLTAGTITYSGTTVKSGATLNMSLNGKPMTVNTTADIESGKTTMTVAATILETNINTAITVANGATTVGQPGFIEPVTVTGTDGRFNIKSPSGAITFSDVVPTPPTPPTPPTTPTTPAKDLGLIQGPDVLLVEVSQGVTMDYNVTASQVINYGAGDNNLMNLLGNITSHLGSADPIEIKKLTNEDLTGIKAAMTNVLKVRSEVGSKQNRMESAEARNTDANFNMTEILSRTEDIDITEKTMEYATMQTIYMASLQTSAKVLQPSLLDYLR